VRLEFDEFAIFLARRRRRRRRRQVGHHPAADPGPNAIKLFTNAISKWSKYAKAGNTKGGSITVLLTSCLTGLESTV
jgi:hypothetical protein